VRVDSDIGDALVRTAKDNARTVSSMVEKIVAEWLRENAYLPSTSVGTAPYYTAAVGVNPALTNPTETSMQIPDDLDDELLDILGRPNFAGGPIARVMRADGADIPHKAEREQAHVLFKLLGFYAAHGVDWRKHAGEWIGEMQERIEKGAVA
jgi:hypothetical protein